jgi:hypothetical protein
MSQALASMAAKQHAAGELNSFVGYKLDKNAEIGSQGL